MRSRPIGVILFGPPASGKDTVTAALQTKNPAIHLFRKLKVGSGRSAGYRPCDSRALDNLRAAGNLLSEVLRYGNTYAVDRPEIERMIAAGEVPVVHTASPTELHQLSAAGGRWLCVLLWCSRRVAMERLLVRDPTDVVARMDVWSNTLRRISGAGDDFDFDVALATDDARPEETAASILDLLSGGGSGKADLTQVVLRPDVLIPVVTLRSRSGGIDWGANAAYAHAVSRQSSTVIVSGSTGRGYSLSEDERLRLRGLWSSVLGINRVVATAWSLKEAQAASKDQPLVLAAPGPGEEIGFVEDLASAAPHAFAYAHPRLRVTISGSEASLPAGAKVSGEGSSHIELLRKRLPKTFIIWHGRASDPQASFAAGADAIVAAALAAVLDPFPGTWRQMTQLEGEERAIVDRFGKSNRVSQLEHLVMDRLT